MIFNFKKIGIYSLLGLVLVFVLRLSYLFVSGDIVFVNNETTILEGEWLSDKEMTLKHYSKEMEYVKNHLGHLKHTINGIQFKVEYDDVVAGNQFFRVLSKKQNEIQIELYLYRFEFFGTNILMFSAHTETFRVVENCIILSTEYFCKENN